MNRPRVAVVVLNWNAWRDTDACLRSLKALTYRPVDLIVVDNASADGSEARLRDLHPDVRVLQSGANLGFAGGNNVGIRDALERSADHVWVLNNDTVVEPDALDHLVARMRRDPACGVCGSTLVDFGDEGRVQALGGSRYNPWTGRARALGAGEPLERALATVDAAAIEARMDYVAGASMFVSRAFVEATGLMDEGYFLFFEELDWIARMPPRLGLGYAPRSVVRHKDGASIGKNARDRAMPPEKRLRYEYYLLRSRLRYTARHAPPCLPGVLATVLATILVRLLRGERSRARTLGRAALQVLAGRRPPHLRASGDAAEAAE